MQRLSSWIRPHFGAVFTPPGKDFLDALSTERSIHLILRALALAEVLALPVLSWPTAAASRRCGSFVF